MLNSGVYPFPKPEQPAAQQTRFCPTVKHGRLHPGYGIPPISPLLGLRLASRTVTTACSQMGQEGCALLRPACVARWVLTCLGQHACISQIWHALIHQFGGSGKERPGGLEPILGLQSSGRRSLIECWLLAPYGRVVTGHAGGSREKGHTTHITTTA